MAYYNTTNLSGDQLQAAIRSANTMDEAVIALFRNGGARTPSEVHAYFRSCGRDWEIWSLRRSITDLTDKGALVKTDVRKMGPRGRPEHVWILAAEGAEA